MCTFRNTQKRRGGTSARGRIALRCLPSHLSCIYAVLVQICPFASYSPVPIYAQPAECELCTHIHAVSLTVFMLVVTSQTCITRNHLSGLTIAELVA